MSNIPLKHLWRNLCREGLEISYTGFIKWADFLEIDRRQGVSAKDCDRLRRYAELRVKASGHSLHRGFEKVQVIRALRQQSDEAGKVAGRVAIRVCELFEACDKSTLYRRAERSGFEFSSRQKYPVSKIIRLVIGGDSEQVS